MAEGPSGLGQGPEACGVTRRFQVEHGEEHSPPPLHTVTSDSPTSPQPASKEPPQGSARTVNMGLCLLTWLSNKVTL